MRGDTSPLDTHVCTHAWASALNARPFDGPLNACVLGQVLWMHALLMAHSMHRCLGKCSECMPSQWPTWCTYGWASALDAHPLDGPLDAHVPGQVLWMHTLSMASRYMHVQASPLDAHIPRPSECKHARALWIHARHWLYLCFSVVLLY